MRVALVAPTCRDSAIPFGGGERYVEELARALAGSCEVRLISYGPRALRERPQPTLERVILKSWTSAPLTPYAPGLRRLLRDHDVIHAFQYYSLPTFLAARAGKRQGSRVFVTDLGGGGWTPAYQIDQSRWIDAHLPLSEYAASKLPGRPRPYHVIYGGVDLELFRMRERSEHDGSLVFLGRILPHKGIHFLIDAAPPDRAVHVIGPAADAGYLADLSRRAQGKRVTFHHGLSDAEVVGFLQRAMALVHPTPVDERGDAGAHELFGLALVEAMACGCPVIASNAASLPEIVQHGVTGFLLPPPDALAIAAAVGELAASRETWVRFSRESRDRVQTRFTWSEVAKRCSAAYGYRSESPAAA